MIPNAHGSPPLKRRYTDRLSRSGEEVRGIGTDRIPAGDGRVGGGEWATVRERCRRAAKAWKTRHAELKRGRAQYPAPLTALHAAETLGRPLGPPDLLDRLAAPTGRDPRPGKRGRKKQEAGGG